MTSANINACVLSPLACIYDRLTGDLLLSVSVDIRTGAVWNRVYKQAVIIITQFIAALL